MRIGGNKHRRRHLASWQWGIIKQLVENTAVNIICKLHIIHKNHNQHKLSKLNIHHRHHPYSLLKRRCLAIAHKAERAAFPIHLNISAIHGGDESQSSTGLQHIYKL
jgi:hypothetical protein